MLSTTKNTRGDGFREPNSQEFTREIMAFTSQLCTELRMTAFEEGTTGVYLC